MRTSEIVTKHIPARTVKQRKETVVCDFCNGKTEIRQCKTCEKDACIRCCAFWDYDPFSGDYNGDYSIRVCPDCDTAVAAVRTLCSNLNNEHFQRIEAIEKNWLESRKQENEK